MGSNGQAKILVVDDNEGIRNLTCKVLEVAGYTVLVAPTGTIALTLMAKKPDLVLQDLVLPDITGYDLVQKLRAASENPRLPILAFTSYLESPDPAYKDDFGFDALLTKPIQNAQLLEAVQAHLAESLGFSRFLGPCPGAWNPLFRSGPLTIMWRSNLG